MSTFRDRVRAALGGLPATFWTLVAGLFVNRIASFVATFLGLYLVRERGFSAGAAGRIVALFGVGVLVAGPVGGVLADAVGRRATMIGSLAAGALVVGSMGFARAPWLLGALTFLAALSSEMYRPPMNAAVVDLVPPQDRARAFGITYWAANLGWSVSFTFAGLVADRSFAALFLADATTSLLFAALVFLRIPETRPAGTHAASPLAGLSRAFRDGPFVTFLLLHLVALVVFVQFQLAAPLDMAARGLGPARFSAVLAVNGIGVVLLQPVLGGVLRTFDGGRLLSASALLFGLGFGVNALAGTPVAAAVEPFWIYVAGAVLWTVGEVVGFPAAAAVVADLAPTALRGRYQGAFSMSWGVAFTIAPLAGGALLSTYGSTTLWLLCLVAGVAVSILHLAAAGPRRRRLAAMQAGAVDAAAAPTAKADVGASGA